MKLPLISVVIPTLNEEKYLERTLKSLKDQNYEGKYEIIVADGLSKDKTVKIAKKYTDKVIIVNRKGISAGRNEGAKVARGDILVFIDADTILFFNSLTELIKPFKNEKVVATSCPIFLLSHKLIDFILLWLTNQFVKASIKIGKPQLPGMCSAYRKDAFNRVGGYDEKMRVAEDYDFSKRVGKLGKSVLIETTFALTSPRRVERWGRRATVRKYISFYLSQIISKKNISGNRFKPVRKSV